MWWNRRKGGCDCVCCVCAQRSVQTRKGRIPSCKYYFILNTFPVVIVGLFSDTEKACAPSDMPQKDGIHVLLSFTLRTGLHNLNHKLNLLAPQSNLIFTVLCCCFFTTTKQRASSFLRRQTLYRAPSWSHIRSFVDIFKWFPSQTRSSLKANTLLYPQHSSHQINVWMKYVNDRFERDFRKRINQTIWNCGIQLFCGLSSE